MDYPYFNQPATNDNYRNQFGQIGQSNNSNQGLLNDDQDKELMLENKIEQNILDSGIDLSKIISFNNDNVDNNFKVVQTNNEIEKPVIEPMAMVEEIKVEASPIVVPTVQPIVEEKTIEPVVEKKENSFLEEVDNARIYQIETNKIVPNPYQPRREFSEEAIQELASSIREYGVLEPLIVKRVEKDQPDGINIEYQLIAGERRLRASRVAGLKTVPALIKTFDSKCLELEVALVENVQREDLSPIMKARAYGQLVNEFGYTQEMVGRRVGKSREAVANALRLLQLPFEAQKALDENKINESHARALLLLPNMEKQRALLGEVLSKQLSSREAEMIARQFLEKQNIKTGSNGRKRLGDSFSPQDLELREKLESLLDAKVMIKRKGEKGEISIFFYSEDEFNGLVDRITHGSEKNINNVVDKLNNI
jgi:ParB family chromosome partitioning protein